MALSFDQARIAPAGCNIFLEQFNLVVLHHALAVDAFERFALHIEHLHACGNGLMVGDALGIGAFDYAHDLLGILDVLFLHNLVILDDVERHVGRNDRETANLFVGHPAIGHFDDAFLTERLGFEVRADGDGAGMIVEMENLYDFEGQIGGDMVDDRAILDGRYFEFFLIRHGFVWVLRDWTIEAID